MEWSKWCCINSALGCQDMGRLGDSIRPQVPVKKTGLPEDFDVMDLVSDHSRIEFVDFVESHSPVQVEESRTVSVKAEASAGNLTLLTQFVSPRARSIHPTLLGSPQPGPTMLPRLGRDTSKADFGLTPRDTTGRHSTCKHSKLMTPIGSRFSRYSASTGAESAEDCYSSDSDFDAATRESRSARGTSRSMTSRNSSHLDIAGLAKEQQPVILYPWEIEAMIAQATVAVSSISRPSSPSRVLERSGGAGDRGRELLRKVRPSGGGPLEPQRRPSPSPESERAKMFTVNIERRDELRKLGLDTRPLVSDVTGALSVERIRAGGLVDEWNCGGDTTVGRHRHRIRKGDMIVEVNGFRGNSDRMYKVISTESSLSLLVMRLPKGQRDCSSSSHGASSGAGPATARGARRAPLGRQREEACEE
mmetsp:Transcript_64700/g.182409  ORF Transcript_64700/g.182409 Transcript_64700/m.182409 type:complete len:419 (-) Transcript_64700:140-1396(-)